MAKVREMDCELCGEGIYVDMKTQAYTEEVGEFWDEKKKDSVVAHAQCGLDAGLQLA